MPRKRPPAEISKLTQDLASGSALGAGSSLRQRLLELAGVTEAEQARLTRLVIEKFETLTKAKVVTRLVVSQGRDNPAIVQEFIDDDGGLQARAAEDLVDVLGLKPSRSQGINTAGGPVNIKVSFAERPAKPVEVIEVK